MDYKKISEFEESDYISSAQYIPVAENGDNKKIKPSTILGGHERRLNLIETTQTIVACTPELTSGDELCNISINGTNKTLYSPTYSISYDDGEITFSKQVNNSTTDTVIPIPSAETITLTNITSSNTGFTATTNLSMSEIKSLVLDEKKYICFYNASASYVYYPNHLDFSNSQFTAHCSGYINGKYKDIKIIISGTSATATYKDYVDDIISYNITLANGYSFESGALNVANYNPITGLVDLHFAVRGTIRAEDHVTIATIPSTIAPSQTIFGTGSQGIYKPCQFRINGTSIDIYTYEQSTSTRGSISYYV